MGRSKTRPRRAAAEAAKNRNKRRMTLENLIADYTQKSRSTKQKQGNKQEQRQEEFHESDICSVSARQGIPEYMEDHFQVICDMNGYSSFGVFDGHGGELCALYLKSEILKALHEHASLADDPENALISSFEDVDRDFSHVGFEWGLGDGSTCTVALVKHHEKNPRLWVANVGDSRCILVKKSGEVIELTRDHCCSLKDEQERIKRGGGKIIDYGGTMRVQGVLAITRAIGDISVKPHVIPTPEVRYVKLDPEQDQFLCIASDGVWDVLSNEAVAQIILKNGIKGGSDLVTKEALVAKSDDNVTFMAIDLQTPTFNKTKEIV